MVALPQGEVAVSPGPLGNDTRLHYFLAQIGHESGGLTIMQENLNYRAQRLCEVWPGRFPDLASASRCAGNPELLANTVYGERMGNRGSASGDGSVASSQVQGTCAPRCCSRRAA